MGEWVGETSSWDWAPPELKGTVFLLQLPQGEKLKVLSLANNQLTGLPGSLVSMHKLAKLNLSHNHMSQPYVTCPHLHLCHEAMNILEKIANQIQELANLKILIVEGNHIHTLPQTDLELLNVDFNALQ